MSNLCKADAEEDGTVSLSDCSDGEDDVGGYNIEEDAFLEEAPTIVPPSVDPSHSTLPPVVILQVGPVSVLAWGHG